MTVAAPAGGPVDRALLADLAARAAVALDNALLYGAERRTGITLQRSLLPRDLPEVDGLRSAARYLPGAAGAFVGGDWYQGVVVDGGLVLAMGDVMGHGMRSAARMGQLRAIIATLAREGHGPAQLLRRLAEGVDVLLDLELATVLVATYDPRERTLTAASAGHPPPLLAPLDGPPRFVDVEPGPPIGSFPYPYAETTVSLAAGDNLVLYTDGLVENREEALDSGLERLRSSVAGLRLPPEQVCDHVLQQLGRTSGGDDDVALLVLSHLPVDPTP
jgi:serine phosphatase RsbU (regulator of sigma subunit)